MDANRFDAISKLFAWRRTRHGAVSGSLGVAGRALARDGTPIATPTIDPNDPHPSADTAKPDPEYLFVQPFDAGTWTPKDDEAGAYTLTLTGAAAQTVYFSDRPERVVGLSPTDAFLGRLGFTPENPPNAAIVAPHDDGEGQEILVIELLNPQYDPKSGTLTYDARVLADYGDPGLASLARQQQDYTLPASFGEGGLFIDDCGSETYKCYGEMSGNYYGKVSVGLCGPWCEPCHPPENYCMDGLPQDCRKETQYEGQTYYSPVCNAKEDGGDFGP